ncbi:MAG: alpha-2-macroglobulin family protein [Bacteroidales bacterium]|nr:alpha-2-macroglobulin family protein [Bacteroidales bacterium]
MKTWDLYDIVFGAFGGKLGQAFAIGGSEAAVDQSKNRARRFEPVVRFIGPFTLAPGKTGTHKIRLPQYTGSVRVMVTAAGRGNTFGSAEKSVVVSDPLMILATAPRVLSPGDRVALPVTVSAQKKEISEVDVTATGNGMIWFTQAAGSVRFTESRATRTWSSCSIRLSSRARLSLMSGPKVGGESAVVRQWRYRYVLPNPPERRAETGALLRERNMKRASHHSALQVHHRPPWRSSRCPQ